MILNNFKKGRVEEEKMLKASVDAEVGREAMFKLSWTNQISSLRRSESEVLNLQRWKPVQNLNQRLLGEGNELVWLNELRGSVQLIKQETHPPAMELRQDPLFTECLIMSIRDPTYSECGIFL
ncbi:MAG: hypothetical protein GTO45_03855 [Candidatus Aminicenantes bacterium]|nr:hypothetical protein [Candidatus Aminicenantes bacterium]NIN17175.1 hypothetical protein [Candidatus Aminicenantes bacterium]NIN41068.1 hypothetical protein [Candidatus Aminicenantes bacterium]NIN83873.1 hypothetical protein [Candidatus Aminicenantes bacterium]NIO79779.1 hypothetical protein [Candidatus Aminicenantes bacterium]